MLSEMDSLVHDLKHLPEYANAESKVDSYYARLEGIVKPRLLSTFASGSIGIIIISVLFGNCSLDVLDDAIKYRKIFHQIGREHHILVYYYQSNIPKIISLWENARGGAQKDSEVGSLTAFFDELLVFIDSQVELESFIN